jgi:hypothetical protein
MSWNSSYWFKANGGGNWYGNLGGVVGSVYRWLRRIRRGG